MYIPEIFYTFYIIFDRPLDFCIRFLSNFCKNDLNAVLGRNLFCIANDCSVNPSDLSKMLVSSGCYFLPSPKQA